ncbi:hypothetical protein BC937DRAFT_94526 [Endogone sp. FLAS-F59071]|nr:hypothetical protein BC937DRAFT_94526 [Endogone sp. FLAS-F59071]|eukprot:RUS20719.1 hypothetical protein BC937DRAFT_94526 [Endogone sp. FLAS-F59071]
MTNVSSSGAIDTSANTHYCRHRHSCCPRPHTALQLVTAPDRAPGIVAYSTPPQILVGSTVVASIPLQAINQSITVPADAPDQTLIDLALFQVIRPIATSVTAPASMLSQTSVQPIPTIFTTPTPVLAVPVQSLTPIPALAPVPIPE